MSLQAPHLKLLLGVGRRLVYYLILLILANFIMYFLVDLAPGDPLSAAFVDPADAQKLGAELGLDRPFLERFFIWLGNALVFDFGFSYKLQLGVPVADMMLLRFGRTALLVLASLLFSLLGALISASLLKPEGKLGAGLRPILLVLSALPAFLMGYWVIQGVNRAVLNLAQMGFIAEPGWYPLPSLGGGLVPYLFAGLVLGLGDATFGDLLRGVDHDFASLAGRRYIHSARTRGASPVRHGLAEMSISLVGLFASRTTFLLGGVVIIEKIFNLEGAGELLWDAAEVRDYSVVVGISFLSTMVVIALAFLADIYQFLVDPRVRQ
ncbi:MAG: ABC transporter permease [Deltaproteobacteria bacterium]|nr:ABC transporter permease [Deltaproteobacteria bacterium]